MKELDKLKPCPFCGHHAYEPVQVRGQGWGSYDWEIRCSSSHCCANVRIVADGWERNLDPELNKHLSPDQLYDNRELKLRRMWNRRSAIDQALAEPIDMLLYCPQCGLQHIDAPDERTPDWKNPPHKSHLCHGCKTVWRQCDRPTNGVKQLASGKDFVALAIQRGEVIEECAKVCEDYSAKKWTSYKTGNGPERANPHVQGESCGADDCAAAIRALVHSTGVPSEQRASSKVDQ